MSSPGGAPRQQQFSWSGNDWCRMVSERLLPQLLAVILGLRPPGGQLFVLHRKYTIMSAVEETVSLDDGKGVPQLSTGTNNSKFGNEEQVQGY